MIWSVSNILESSASRSLLVILTYDQLLFLTVCIFLHLLPTSMVPYATNFDWGVEETKNIKFLKCRMVRHSDPSVEARLLLLVICEIPICISVTGCQNESGLDITLPLDMFSAVSWVDLVYRHGVGEASQRRLRHVQWCDVEYHLTLLYEQ